MTSILKPRRSLALMLIGAASFFSLSALTQRRTLKRRSGERDALEPSPPQAWRKMHAAAVKSESRQASLKPIWRSAIAHTGVVLVIFSGLIYGSLWLSYFMFLTNFDVSPREVGLGGLEAVTNLGLPLILLFGSLAAIFGGLIFFNIIMVSRIAYPLVGRAITAAMRRGSARDYVLARLVGEGIRPRVIERAHTADLGAQVDSVDLPPRKRQGQEGLFATLRVGWPFAWLRWRHWLDPPTLAALNAYKQDMGGESLIYGADSSPISAREIKRIVRELKREGKGLLAFPVARSLGVVEE